MISKLYSLDIVQKLTTESCIYSWEEEESGAGSGVPSRGKSRGLRQRDTQLYNTEVAHYEQTWWMRGWRLRVAVEESD